MRINCITLLKRFIKVLLRKDVFFKPDFFVPSERLGSSYGGWNLVTGLIHSHSVIYSFGIGEDASFDLALIARFGVSIHAFDPTPQSISWIKAQGPVPNFFFHPFAVGGLDGVASFFPPRNPRHVSHSMHLNKASSSAAFNAPVKRLKTIMNQLGHSNIDVLKMDIEGSEYEVLNDMIHSGIYPKQLLVEFHHRFPEIGIQMTKRAVKQIRGFGYGLTFVSESGEEFSFVKR